MPAVTAMEGELRAAAAGYEWFARTWGEPSNPPFLLIHGVTSDSGTFWRLGPALAERGRRVVAVDPPGHGETRGWRGRHRFRATAAAVAAFGLSANLGAPTLAARRHSSGGIAAA